MSLLSCPDINVWLALASPEHPHSAAAREWWNQETGQIAFSRLTQLGLLRLMTTSAAMDGKPLSMDAAWAVYDRFFEDDRVTFLPESAEVDRVFRRNTTGHLASPKVWADAWLLAFCRTTGAVLVTFDRALSARGAHILQAP